MKANYKISSRTAVLLGRENVSKADGAIIELIKNSYDADATICAVYFDIENDSIYIIDNGCGMDENDLVNKWLTIGTDNKKLEFKTSSNRIKSGEKGIGRLALDRLGSKYNLYTKKKNQDIFHLYTDWNVFEQDGLNLEDVGVDINIQNSSFYDLSKVSILSDLKINEFSSGTIIHISGLRDNWIKSDLNKIYIMLGYLLPPVDQKKFVIFYKDSIDKERLSIEPVVNETYDYKIESKFDGERFSIKLFRNEFDLNIIPESLFSNENFSKYPYRKKDFESGYFEFNKNISELLKTSDLDKINKVKEIGPFSFNYIFMKIQASDKDYKTFFYKKISTNRTLWIKENCGIKIYRDGFMVRPYGDKALSDAFDWLGLDARKATSPASISHSGMGWKVRNSQGQGTLVISRINNANILDKSSREGIIDNEYFSLLKDILREILSIFERDRAYIGKNLKLYNDIVNEKSNVKKLGQEIAKKVLKADKDILTKEEQEKLAQAVNYYKEESEELLSEIKLLRSLSTNGLITTSIVHDLKTMSATFVSRVNYIQDAIKNSDTVQLNDCLEALNESDKFLKSWISILISQVKNDRRKRKNEELAKIIFSSVKRLSPILNMKKINISLEKDFDEIVKKIFIVDFEAIIYNLVINSIESFEKSKCSERKINIFLSLNNNNLDIIYSDNGDGLGDKFQNPYDIFNFGVTSKYDKYGEKVGTGLGMYIVASTVSEYNGSYELLETKKSFKIKITIPCNEV